MGGMAADVRDLHNTLERVTFTPEGILFLAQHGHFCEVYRTDIEDKSKADILAKSLVCMQVLWPAGQALERKIAGLPTTLLEIHTIVHVFCALLMYCLWFQKPLNVQDPTIINLREDRHLLAFFSSRPFQAKTVRMGQSSQLCSTRQVPEQSSPGSNARQLHLLFRRMKMSQSSGGINLHGHSTVNSLAPTI